MRWAIGLLTAILIVYLGAAGARSTGSSTACAPDGGYLSLDAVVLVNGAVEVTGCTNCDAVYGRATGAGNAGDFHALGSGIGVQATATAGPAIRALGNPHRATIVLVPQAMEPSTCDNGGIYYDSEINKFRGCVKGTWIDLH